MVFKDIKSDEQRGMAFIRKRARILYACAQLPWPLDGGHKVVSYNDIKHLSSCFDLDVVSFLDPKSIRNSSSTLNILHDRFPGVTFLPPVEHTIHKGSNLSIKIKWFLRSFGSGYPYIVNKYRNEDYLAKIDSALRKQVYEGIYIESTPLGYLLTELDQSLLSKTRVIFRPHDSLAETIMKYSNQVGWTASGIAARIDAWNCRKFEEYLWRNSDQILAVTRRLTSLIAQCGKDIAQKVKYFPVSIEPPFRRMKIRKDARTVLYIGTVHYPPNRLGLEWFIQNCWQRITDEIHDARLVVVGKGGAELSAHDKSIDILDYVVDLQPVYDDADVFIVPLFAGSGIRLKILDAMRNGLPVVSTTTGYFGLEVTEGEELLVADAPDDFSEHVIRLLRDPSLRVSLTEKGQNFVEQYHSAELARKVVEELSASI